MGIFDWFGDLISKASTHPTQLTVPTDHVDKPELSGKAFAAEQHYLRIWLREMCLAKEGEWFTKRYPTVHSVVVLQYGNRTVELSNIAGRSRLNVKQANAGRSEPVNYQMTGLLPFRGGTVEVDCGLMSLENGNAISELADVVNDFASVLVGPQISAVIEQAVPIAKGVQRLLGAGEAVPKLYYHTTFTATGGGAPLVSGFIFLSSAKAGTVKAEQLWIEGDHALMGASRAEAKRIEGVDYVLLQIECVKERDDWEQLTTIAEPLGAAVDAKLDGEDELAKKHLTAAIIAAGRSTDLTLLDRKRVIQAIKDRVAAVSTEQGASTMSKQTGAQLRIAMEAAVPAEEADGLPTLEEALRDV